MRPEATRGLLRSGEEVSNQLPMLPSRVQQFSVTQNTSSRLICLLHRELMVTLSGTVPRRQIFYGRMPALGTGAGLTQTCWRLWSSGCCACIG